MKAGGKRAAAEEEGRSVVARHPRKMHRNAHGDAEKTERVKAMPHSATLATRLGAELKARILPQRGDAALAPHKSSCFCSEQGGENRWSPHPSASLLSCSHPVSIYLFIYSSIYLSIHPLIFVPVYPFIYSIFLHLATTSFCSSVLFFFYVFRVPTMKTL